MSRDAKEVRAMLLNIADFLSEEVPVMTDDEITRIIEEAGFNAADATSLIKSATVSAIKEHGISRLAQARAVLDKQNRAGAANIVDIDATRAKQILKTYWQKHPDREPIRSTLAARNGGEMTDDTALKMFASLVELGAVSPDGEVR